MTIIVLHVAHLDQDFLLFSAATVPACLGAKAVLKLRQVGIELEFGRAADPTGSFAADYSCGDKAAIIFALVTVTRRTNTILS